MELSQSRTWAEVSLSAIENNYHEFRRVLPASTRFLGVVKANAYGHGALQVARCLEKCGADYLAVACLSEALELREHGITLPILILGATPAEYASVLAQNNITQAVECETKGLALSENLADGESLKIHIKLDTGMGRIGFRADSQDELNSARKVMQCDNLVTEGCFMHFAVSDVLPAGAEYTAAQYQRFLAAVEYLEQGTGKTFKIRHCGNSGVVLNYREYALDMVRPGLLTYGMYPDKETGGLALQPAMSLKTRIAAITHHKKGDTISYGRTWTAPGDCTLAVIPIGYADGLHRILSNKLEVLLHGKRVRQVGRICMDMCMIDVTGIPEASVGDVVTLFGTDGKATLLVEEMAEKAGTINYEIPCSLSPRVPRIYVE